MFDPVALPLIFAGLLGLSIEPTVLNEGRKFDIRHCTADISPPEPR